MVKAHKFQGNKVHLNSDSFLEVAVAYHLPVETGTRWGELGLVWGAEEVSWPLFPLHSTLWPSLALCVKRVCGCEVLQHVFEVCGRRGREWLLCFGAFGSSTSGCDWQLCLTAESSTRHEAGASIVWNKLKFWGMMVWSKEDTQPVMLEKGG